MLCPCEQCVSELLWYLRAIQTELRYVGHGKHCNCDQCKKEGK